MYLITVDAEKCEGCGECAEACPGAVFAINDGKAEVVGGPDDCLGCETCVTVCPTGAVTMQEL